MDIIEVEAFLIRLAVEGNVSASTQNRALAALSLPYRETWGIGLPGLKDVSATMISTHVLNPGG